MLAAINCMNMVSISRLNAISDCPIAGAAILGTSILGNIILGEPILKNAIPGALIAPPSYAVSGTPIFNAPILGKLIVIGRASIPVGKAYANVVP